MGKKRNQNKKAWTRKRKGRYATAPIRMSTVFSPLPSTYNARMKNAFQGHAAKLAKTREIEKFIQDELVSTEKLNIYYETIADSQAITRAQKETIRGIVKKPYEKVTIFDKRGVARLYDKATQA